MKTFKRIICASCLFISFAVFSNNARYRLVITDDPSTTITIGWDQISGSNPIVYYGTTDYGTEHQNYLNTKSVDRFNSSLGMNNNFAKLTGLIPDSSYYFVIQDSDGTSSRYWFKTAPSTNETMSFISGGDSRNNRGPRQNANLLVSKLKPTAVFFGGDMTAGDTAQEWVEWMDDWQQTTATDGRMFPILPTRGNHEKSNASIYDLFNTSSENVYYEITFGANLYTIYTLNSEISAGGDQLLWLDDKLASDTSIWKSAQYHKPMRPHQSNKDEGNDEYTSWAQIFYDYGVKLVYESDSHVVKTTYPIKPCSSGEDCEEGFEVDNVRGTVYVGEGCWGAPIRPPNDNKTWTRDSGMFNQFKWVTVSKDNILVQTIKVDNAPNVGENSNTEAPGVLPIGTDVWEPANGNTVTIDLNDSEDLTVAIISHTNNQKLAIGNSTITAIASSLNGAIVSVEFKVDGVSIGADTSSPYNISHNFLEGFVSLDAIATDNLGATKVARINLVVGSSSIIQNFTATEDIEQQSDNSVIMDSSDLELVYEKEPFPGDQTIGIEFSDITIPSDVIVTKAYVQFTAKSTKSSSANYLVSVENSGNAALLSDVSGGLTDGRSYHSAVSWIPGPWVALSADVNERTSDISSQIQSTLNLDSWSSGNRIVVKIIADGATVGATSTKRRAHSKNGGYPPILHIEYKDNEAPTIEITSHINNQNLSSGNAIITAIASDADGTIESIEFKVNGVSIGTDTTTPFNMMHNFLDGFVNLEVIAIDNMGAKASQSINFTVGNSLIVKDFSATQDVEQQIDNSVNIDSQDLEFVYDNVYTEGDQKIGIEFSDITIPSDVTVTKAYIQFTAKNTKSSSANYLISVENSGNASLLSDVSGGLTDGRSYHSAVSWIPGPWVALSADVNERTSDISSQIQSTLNLGSWVSGNRIVVKIVAAEATVGSLLAQRRAYSRDKDILYAPVLHIEYNYSATAVRNNVLLDADFKVFPNPFSDLIYFETSFNLKYVTVFSLDGKRVNQIPLVRNSLNLSHLQKGTYLLRFENAKNEIISRYVVKK